MLSILCAFAISSGFSFYGYGPYDSAIPRPEQILGFDAGERHSTFRDQELVLNQIAAKAPDRVKIFNYGKSVEGRPLKIVAVSSPQNIARLDALRETWNKLANPDKGTSGVIPNAPVLVWINETIHGDETASFESAMWLVYNLVASQNSEISKALENAVVVVNPVYNPDGHERFVVWYNSVATGASEPFAFEQREPGLLRGRTNHYRFDLNRDRVAMSQDETRQEVAEWLKWNPQVYADQHGQVSSYFFPPNPMSINADVDRGRLNNWTEIFGKANARAFDKNGWPYFVRDTFDLFYAGYLDSWASLSGAIGMTYETDGGSNLRTQREDGSIVTLRDGIAKHFTSALATIRTAAERSDELLRSFADFKARASSGEAAGKFRRVVVTSEDTRPLKRLAAQLARGGIKSYFSRSQFSQSDAHDYWSAQDKPVRKNFAVGSLVIDMAQPQGALAKSLLQSQNQFEPQFIKEQLEKRKAVSAEEEYPGQEGADFYDVTGWSLIYAYNLPAWWCESAPAVEAGTPTPIVEPVSESAIGWALRYRDRDDALAALDLLSQGVKVLQTTREMRLGGEVYWRGTFLILRSRNDEAIRQVLQKERDKRNVTFEPLSTSYPETGKEGPGSESVTPLREPGIAVVFGNGADSPTNFGGIWYLLEREFKLPFTPLNASALNNDLSKYSCIIFPAGRNTATDRLKQWLRDGGCAIVLGNPGWAIGDKNLLKLDEAKADKGEPADIPGSIFRARIEPRLRLTYGYSAGDIAVPLSGSTFYKVRRDGGSAVFFAREDGKLLSGWEWPDDTEKNLRDVVWLQDQPYARGHVVVFAQDPSSRALWPGLDKLLLNSILLGAKP